MPITPTWPDDLRLTPYFSRMTSDSLRTLAPNGSGPMVYLFPAQGNPIVVSTRFHPGHASHRRPIDLDLSPYLDLDGDRVVELSSRMVLFPRLPIQSSEVLKVGFAVYFCSERVYKLHRNACLQNLFTTPVPIAGNVVVATVSADGVVIDVTAPLLQQALLVAGISRSNGHPPTIHTIMASNYYPTHAHEIHAWDHEHHLQRRPVQPCYNSLLFSPDISSLLLPNMGFRNLIRFSQVSAIFRYRVGHELATRWNAKLGKPYVWSKVNAFFDAVHKSHALIVGGIVRDIMLDIPSRCLCMDIICPAGVQTPLLGYLESNGFSFLQHNLPDDSSQLSNDSLSPSHMVEFSDSTVSSPVPVIADRMRDHVDGVAYLTGPFKIRLIHSKYRNPFRTLLNSSNTYQLNAMTGTRFYSFYPNTLFARRGIEMWEDTSFRFRHPDLPLDRSNSAWTVPCGTECPAVWNKSIGNSPVLAFLWRTNNTSLAGAVQAMDIPQFTADGWEDDVDALMYRLIPMCDNSLCEFRSSNVM